MSILQARRSAIASQWRTGLKGYLFGLTLSNGTDATNDIDIATGAAADASGYLMVLATGLTKQLDAAWAVGTNAGGRDTGSIANGTWHVWLIQNSDSMIVDVLFSLSASAPTMPTGYNRKRRIGSILRESAAIVVFIQTNDIFLRSVPANDANATNPGTSAVTLTLSVPTGIVISALFSASINDTTPAAATFMLLTALSQADSVPSGTLSDVVSAASGALIPSKGSGDFARLTNTSAQMRYRLDASNTDIFVLITTYGWIDTRGRLS